MKTRNVFLYDDACRRCRRFGALVRALDVTRRMELVTVDSPRAEALLPGMSRWDRLSAIRFLAADGRRFERAEAVSELFAVLPLTGWAWRPARALVPALGSAVRALYARASARRGAAS